uniref:nucleotide exchange factor SIL1 n=1 Tax=Myxine glutinosa TaxID=7769 RepID=UPI00358E45B7
MATCLLLQQVYDCDRKFKSGVSSVADAARSGWPHTADTPKMVAGVECVLRENRCIMLDEVVSELNISHGSAHHIIHNVLGFCKVSAWWVPRQLTLELKEWQVDASKELLRRYLQFRRAATFLIARSDWMKAGSTTFSQKRRGQAKSAIRSKRRGLLTTGALLQHDDARPQTARATAATIEDLHFECLPHPSSSPDLAPSDYHIFGPLKEALGGTTFRSDEEVQEAGHEWLHKQPEDCFSGGIQALSSDCLVQCLTFPINQNDDEEHSGLMGSNAFDRVRVCVSVCACVRDINIYLSECQSRCQNETNVFPGLQFYLKSHMPQNALTYIELNAESENVSEIALILDDLELSFNAKMVSPLIQNLVISGSDVDVIVVIVKTSAIYGTNEDALSIGGSEAEVTSKPIISLQRSGCSRRKTGKLVGKSMRMWRMRSMRLFMAFVLVLWVCSMKLEAVDHSQGQLILVDTEENKATKDDDESVVDNLDEEDLAVFQPTNTWQRVHPGQGVPAGLHVRLNLQTGEREAKLLDQKVGDAGGPSKGDWEGVADDDSRVFSSTELKRTLKLLKDDTVGQAKQMDGVKTESDSRQSFRSMEELRKDFEELGLFAEPDSAVMARLLEVINNTRSLLEVRRHALRELEYHVHQVDNAQDLVKLGGLIILVRALNDSMPEIREGSAFVLGSALSSNPQVQVQAVEGGLLQRLVVLLATDHSLPVRKKALFAIATMLRHFPYAQRRFLDLGGVSLLSQLLETDRDRSLWIRIVTLAYDMLWEKHEADRRAEVEPESQWERAEKVERARQYSAISLLPTLRQHGWCERLPALLAHPDHDAREKVLRCMAELMRECREEFLSASGLQAALGELQSEYQKLAATEQIENEPEGYFNRMLYSVQELQRQFGW